MSVSEILSTSRLTWLDLTTTGTSADGRFAPNSRQNGLRALWPFMTLYGHWETHRLGKNMAVSNIETVKFF